MLLHLWLVLRKQTALIRRSAITSVVVMGLGGAFTAAVAAHAHSVTRVTLALFALTVAAAAAVGAAFITRSDPPPELELTLATPTNLGTVMIARLTLVLSYSLVLALAASFTIALATGASLSALMLAWLGPMLVLASASFALTLLLGSVVALLGTCVLAAWQLVQVHLAGSFGVVVAPHLWQLNPFTLALIIAVLLAATRYASAHPKHA